MAVTGDLDEVSMMLVEIEPLEDLRKNRKTISGDIKYKK